MRPWPKVTTCCVATQRAASLDPSALDFLPPPSSPPPHATAESCPTAVPAWPLLAPALPICHRCPAATPRCVPPYLPRPRSRPSNRITNPQRSRSFRALRLPALRNSPPARVTFASLPPDRPAAIARQWARPARPACGRHKRGGRRPGPVPAPHAVPGRPHGRWCALSWCGASGRVRCCPPHPHAMRRRHNSPVWPAARGRFTLAGAGCSTAL